MMDNSEQGAVVRYDRGHVICDTFQKVRCEYIEKSLEYSTTSEKIVKVTQMLTGDFAFQIHCLGKESMLNKWCIYCMLRPREWSILGHEPSHLWTIQSLNEMADDITRKGADRLGVECCPTFP